MKKLRIFLIGYFMVGLLKGSFNGCQGACYYSL